MRKKHFTRKLCSLIVAGALLLGLLPATAFAAGEYTAVYLGDGVDHADKTTAQVELGGGTVSWDAETATVTLENVNVSQSSYWISILPVNTTQTVTLILKGANSFTDHTGSPIHVKANLLIQAEEGASLTVTADEYANAFWVEGGVLTIEGGTYDLTTGNPTLYGDLGVTLTDANVTAVSTGSNAIYTPAAITISGGISDFTGYYPALWSVGTMTLKDGANITADSSNDVAIYSVGALNIENGADITATSASGIALYSNGAATITDSKLDLTSGPGSSALYVDNAASLSIQNSVLEITAGNAGLYANGGNIEITDSQINIDAGGNPINTSAALDDFAGTLTITGADTVINADGAYPIFGDTIEIRGATISSQGDSGTAISANGDITIADGADVTASTSAQMAAIYSIAGNIDLQGKNTKVSATSDLDSAIFTRNGTITLNAGTIKASAAEGFAAITARKSAVDADTATEEKPQTLIIIGENFADTSNKVATTVWKEADDGTMYADTILVSKDTVLNDDGLLDEDYVPEKNEISAVTPDEDDTPVITPSIPTITHSDGWEQNRNGEWVYYQNGRRATGWIEVEGISYYLEDDGVMVTGWQYMDGAWYYFYTWGGMAEGWAKIDGYWYYLDPETGEMATGWKYVNGDWYYLYPAWGGMAEGWMKVGGVWYNTDPVSGVMQTGWELVNGKWYYFYESGSMAYSTTVEGYAVGADGAWIQ